MKYKNIILATAVLLLIIPITTVSAYAQQTLPPLIPSPSPSPPPPVPMTMLPSQSQAPRLPLPPQAQIDHQKNVAILDELFKRIGGDTSQTHVAAVIKEMQSIYPGQLHCPTITNPGSCYAEQIHPISPPIAP